MLLRQGLAHLGYHHLLPRSSRLRAEAVARSVIHADKMKNRLLHRGVVRAPLSNRQNCQRWTQQKQSVYHWGLCIGTSSGAESVLSLRGRLTRRKRYDSLVSVCNGL